MLGITLLVILRRQYIEFLNRNGEKKLFKQVLFYRNVLNGKVVTNKTLPDTFRKSIYVSILNSLFCWFFLEAKIVMTVCGSARRFLLSSALYTLQK